MNCFSFFGMQRPNNLAGPSWSLAELLLSEMACHPLHGYRWRSVVYDLRLGCTKISFEVWIWFALGFVALSLTVVLCSPISWHALGAAPKQNCFFFNGVVLSLHLLTPPCTPHTLENITANFLWSPCRLVTHDLQVMIFSYQKAAEVRKSPWALKYQSSFLFSPAVFC